MRGWGEVGCAEEVGVGEAVEVTADEGELDPGGVRSVAGKSAEDVGGGEDGLPHPKLYHLRLMPATGAAMVEATDEEDEVEVLTSSATRSMSMETHLS